MKIQKYHGELESAWDQMIAKSKNGNFLHLRKYMEYHSDRFVDESVLIMSGQRVLAAFPCNRIGDIIVSHGGLTYSGLLYGKDLHAEDVLQIFYHMRQYFSSIGCDRILYKAVPHIFHRYPAEEDLYALFRFRARLIKRDISSVVDIGSRIKFSDSRKSTARKAEKAGALFVELNDFIEFHQLLSLVLKKYSIKPVHSASELKMLKERFPQNIRLFGACVDGKLLSAVLLYDFGHAVHCQYMASSELGRSVGALDFILSRLIQITFIDKKYFSFGISTEQEGLILNEGLIRQKEGFGARGVVHDLYEWEFQRDSFS